MQNILPDSRPKVQKRITYLNGINWVPIYCANCGSDGGMVPEENCNFAFYLCVPCAEKWQPLADTLLVPDEVFWQRVREEQLATYGRELTPEEIVEVLKDENSALVKLSKERADFNRTKMM